MGAFKDLNSSDIFLTEYVASKAWNISEVEFRELGVSKIYVQSGSIPYYLKDSDIKPTYIWDTTYESGSYYSALAYQSLDLQYYRATLSDSDMKGSFSGSYNISEQSTITIPGSRVLGSKALIYSIPRSIFSSFIQMKSVKITSTMLSREYVDNEGILQDSETGKIVGDVFYDKGLIVITDSPSIATLSTGENIQFISNKHINTYNVSCNVKDREYNFTYNPTAKRLNSSTIEFTPYITSVGLYNDANELLAVAKMSRPIKKASNVDMTFKIQLDVN